MNTKNEENLDDLLRTFMDPDSAARAAEDFRQVDLIFEKHPSPEPGSRLLASIKADIRRELGHSKGSIFKTAMLKFTAAAAVFLMCFSVWFMMNPRDTRQPKSQPVAQVAATTSAGSIWESEDVTTHDAQYETFEREIEQIESEIVAIKYGTDSTVNGESKLTEIENDLIEIQSDFWKG